MFLYVWETIFEVVFTAQYIDEHRLVQPCIKINIQIPVSEINIGVKFSLWTNLNLRYFIKHFCSYFFRNGS